MSAHIFDRVVRMLGRYYSVAPSGNRLSLAPVEAREAAGVLIGLGYIIAKNAGLDADSIVHAIKDAHTFAVSTQDTGGLTVIQGGSQ